MNLIQNFSWLILERSIRIIGSLFIGIWVARYLGPESFGLLSFAIAIVAFFTVLVDLGLSQIVVRELKIQPHNSNSILGSAFILKLCGGLLSVVFITIIGFFLYPNNLTLQYILIILGLGLIFQSADVIDYLFQSRVQSRYVVWARTAAFLLSTALKIYLIISQKSVFWFATAVSLDLLSAGIFLFIANSAAGINWKKWTFSQSIAIQLIRYSWPLLLSTLLITIHTKVDQVMLQSALGNASVGIYAVACQLAVFWLFLPTLLVSTLMPYFLELRETNKTKYQSQLQQLYSLMFWAGIAAALITMLYAEQIIVILYGDAYIEAAKALKINIWASVFISQAIVRGIWLIAENLQKYRLFNNILAVITNISLNMLLIPQFGMLGAAVATLFTQFLGTWIFSLLWKPVRPSTVQLIKAINPRHLRVSYD